MRRGIAYLAAAAGVSMTVSAASAALVVDWGGNTVSQLRLFQNAGPSNSTVSGYFGGFSGGAPLLISPTTTSLTYSGGAFYGHVAWNRLPGYTENTGNGASILEQGTADRIELKMGGTDLAAVVLWRQSDFLNGLNTGDVGFDSTSTAAMNINTYAGFAAGRVVIRLQGGSNDGYYVSQQTPFNGAGSKSAGLTSLTWLEYDPASSLTTFGAAANLLQSGKIANVTEVGFYFQANTLANNALRLDSFEVGAVVIPEPVAGLMLGTATLALPLLRRRSS